MHVCARTWGRLLMALRRASTPRSTRSRQPRTGGAVASSHAAAASSSTWVAGAGVGLLALSAVLFWLRFGSEIFFDMLALAQGCF